MINCRMRTVAQRIIGFYESLRPPPRLPKGIEILFPQQSEAVMAVVRQFFNKFYNDQGERRLVFGINPGRFGAGTTGINFTAPKQLREICEIQHSFRDQSELSAEFIYELIRAFGGPELFYRQYFVTSVSPLGFVKNGLNLNYYDDKRLLRAVTPFIVASIRQQLAIGFKTDYCICIGGDKNFSFFSSINDDQHFFERIVSLPHPRFIMQYRRRQMQKYIDQYLSALQLAS